MLLTRRIKPATLMHMKESSMRFSIYAKAFAVLVAISFVGVIFIGLAVESFVPQINSDNGVCLFERSAGCTETIAEHVAQWQQTFAISPEDTIISLLIGLLVLFAAVLVISIPSNAKNNLHEHFVSKISIHTGKNQLNKLFNYILLAFSKGILHPKLF